MNLIDQPDRKELNSQKGKHNMKCTEHYQKMQRRVLGCHKSISEEEEDDLCRDFEQRRWEERERREKGERDKELNFIPVLLPEWGAVLGECEDSG